MVGTEFVPYVLPAGIDTFAPSSKLLLLSLTVTVIRLGRGKVIFKSEFASNTKFCRNTLTDPGIVIEVSGKYFPPADPLLSPVTQSTVAE
jgi:hypothetical protein